MEFYNYDTVRKEVHGKWLFILERIAPELNVAIKKVGRHVPCPIRGGTDGFRLFKDAHETGGGISNQEGPFPDGFSLLMWLRGWTFQECMQEVAEQLGIQPEEPRRPKIEGNVQDLKNAKTYFGILKDFGAARYQNDPKNELSYYVTLVFKSGVFRKFWGVDLERAIAECGVQLGEHVTLANLGREPVIVTVDKKDKNGVVVGQDEIESFRNTWSVIRSHAAKANTEAQATVETVEAHAAQVEIVPTATLRVSGSDFVSTVQRPNHLSMLKPAIQEPAKVLPFSKVQPKQWLIEAQERAQANLERERQVRAKAAEKVMKVWDECVQFPSEHAEPMRRYFQNRSILFRMQGAEGQDSLRFHPALPYHDQDGKLVREFPAIVCAIRDVHGELITLHRTYITPAGKKAPVDMVRKMMSVPEGMSVKGAAIQLGIPQGVLGVAEGLETALSAYRATQVPTWSTVSAMLMESLEIPESVRTVLIWTDKDKSVTGERAAKALHSKLIAHGIKAHVLMPQIPRGSHVKSVDWNDVLCSQGLLGFPPVRHLF